MPTRRFAAVMVAAPAVVAGAWLSVAIPHAQAPTPGRPAGETALDRYVAAPDSAQFYLDELPGETLVRYVPDVGHDISTSDAVRTLTTPVHVVPETLPFTPPVPGPR